MPSARRLSSVFGLSLRRLVHAFVYVYADASACVSEPSLPVSVGTVRVRLHARVGESHVKLLEPLWCFWNLPVST